MKIIKISFLLCFLAFSAYADDEKTYVFEAKGEFGEELKELIQKHSKDENVEINIYEKSRIHEVKPSRRKFSFKRGKKRGFGRCWCGLFSVPEW